MSFLIRASLDSDGTRRFFPRLVWVGVLAVLLLGGNSGVAHSAPDGFADLAEKLLPSVVNVSATRKEPELQMRPGRPPGVPMPQLPPGMPFEEFFREFMERERPGGPPQEGHSLGSGFIIDADGYIVTNHHVIAQAGEIRVTLHSGEQLKAEIVGHDDKTDLALLKVDAETPLPAVEFANSDKARVGDWVVAIGNPFGLGGSVTAGIISARARDINSGPYDDYIQTDAPINRGNSGGPLFNLDGRVVGVNTAIFSPTGGSVGIGFSVPANLAQPVLSQLREFGKTRRGWLGVRIQKVTEEIADSLGMGEPVGALVAKVNPGEPAARAGIEAGDVIIEFDGKPVPDVRKLQRIVAETDVNRPVEVTVWRNEGTRKLRVTVGELEAFEQASAQSGGTSTDSETVEKFDDMGMRLSSLSTELRQRFQVSDDTQGVLIVEVDREGEAAMRGLRQGDLIVEVGQEEVSSPEQVKAKIANAAARGKSSVLFLVQRENDLRFIPMSVSSG